MSESAYQCLRGRPVVATCTRLLGLYRCVHAHAHISCDWSLTQYRHHVAAGGLFLILPTVYLCTCVRAMRLMPSKILSGDSSFLRAYSFIVSRLKPGYAWYFAWLSVKNILIAAAPMTANVVVQTVLGNCSHFCAKVLGNIATSQSVRMTCVHLSKHLQKVDMLGTSGIVYLYVFP